jgi:hypothetical protein
VRSAAGPALIECSAAAKGMRSGANGHHIEHAKSCRAAGRDDQAPASRRENLVPAECNVDLAPTPVGALKRLAA